MTLDPQSVGWAIDFIYDHSDGDLFPRILEIKAIVQNKTAFVTEVANKNLDQLTPSHPRRFIVPKDEISYRQATQLDPQDSIILAAIVHQFGSGIEDRRKPQDIVFSYRFSPSTDHGLYSSQSGWNDFWAAVREKSATTGAILYCDIADFYNQIYHHTVENQLIESGFPNQAVKWVIKLLEQSTAGVSRGVPVGPHPIHILAEATLIPIDNSFTAQGISFLRYADDILIFCKDTQQARNALSTVANILDQQQRLTLQRHKTRFLSPHECISLCDKMVEDQPINNKERDLLKIVKRYSGGNPYKSISYDTISEEDWGNLSEHTITTIIEEYLHQTPTDFIRLRWFYRRLSQIGHPGGIRISIDRISDLTPCLASICNYISSVQEVENEEWQTLGSRLISLVSEDPYQQNEYFRLSVLSLFSRNSTLNHLPDLISQYRNGDPFVRREVILAARNGDGIDWLRELKESFGNMDKWQKRAFIFCCSKFPSDEKNHFLRRFPQERPFEKILLKWAKSSI